MLERNERILPMEYRTVENVTESGRLLIDDDKLFLSGSIWTVKMHLSKHIKNSW